MSFAVSGFQTVAQNYISDGVASNWYTKCPLLAVLAAMTIGATKKPLQIGRPGSGEILSGQGVSPAEKLTLDGINEYVTPIQGFKTNNTAARTGSGRTTAPTVADPLTKSHGQATQYAGKFKWTHIDTPILVWHEDKIRAGQKETKKGQGLAMSKILDRATEVALQDHTDWMADMVWNGDPTNQAEDLWDKPAGVIAAADSSNTYAGVNRADSDAIPWRANKDTTARTADIRKLIDDVNLDKGLMTKGNGVSLGLTTIANYKVFKAQAEARGGGLVLANGLPEFAKMGMRKEGIMVDNCFITYDPGCPANNVAFFNLRYWKFIMHPLFNAGVTPFEKLSVATEGGKWADQAFVQSRFILSCDDPANGVARYTNVS